MTPNEALATLKRLAEARKAIGESSGVIAALRRDDFDATVEETDFPALAEAVAGMRSMLLRCCTSVVDPTGREEIDVPNLREAMNHADKADAFVNDQFADMTCRAYQAEDQLAAANAEIARLRERVGEMEASARRYAYVRDALARLNSPKMDGQHYWQIRNLKTTGSTFDKAIDKAITDLLEGGGKLELFRESEGGDGE